MFKYKDLPKDLEKKIDAKTEKAYLFSESENYKKATELSIEAFQLIPKPREEYGYTCIILNEVIDYILLDKDYEKAIEMANTLDKFYINENEQGLLFSIKGKIYFRANQLEESYKFFKKAVDLDSIRILEYDDIEDKKYYDFYQNPDSYLIKENTLEKNDKNILSDDIHDKLEKISKKGDKFQIDGEYILAIEEYTKGLSLLPIPMQKWDAYGWLQVAIADCYFDIENFNLAKQHYFNALSNDTMIDNPYIHFGIGQSFFELNELDDAKEYLMKTYMLDGKDLFNDYDEKYFNLIESII